MPPKKTLAKPMLVRLYVLGQFRLQTAPPRGRRRAPATPPPTHKMESLLAYLALHPEPVARERLAELIWCDVPEPQARSSLRNALAALRKHTGPCLLTEGDTIQLGPEVWVDAVEFKNQATRFLASASPSLQDVDVALYQGDLLADFYDEWILAEREHYGLLYIETLLRLAQVARAQSEFARAIEFAQLVLRSDPANEHAHQHLMFAHLASGNRPAALAQYQTCRTALQTELDVEPMLETTALYEWIRQAAPLKPGLAARLTNLPIPGSSFIGRKRETARIKDALTRHRLVTLTGAGGSGKTRLAIQAASDLVDRFADGTWWVELGPLIDELLVPQAVAKTLGMSEATDQPVSDTLAYWIGTRQILVVLDTCEHLISACAQLSEKLLLACPGLVILATSREALGVPGEWTFLVPLLALPNPQDPLPVLQDCEAIRLFVERARAIQPDFALTGENATAAAQICQRLEGIPLALELAAARVRVMSVEEIAANLDDRLSFATTDHSVVLPRQQTMRALIDWSYDLLSAQEKMLFRRLAVFSGTRSLLALEEVCSGDDLPAEAILDLLTRLIDKSLVWAQEQNGTLVYRMLDTIQQYAYARMYESGEVESVQDRHLEYYLAFAELADSKLRGPEQLAWVQRLDAEHNNLRVALEWARRRDAEQQRDATLRLASHLCFFWSLRGYWNEGRMWLEQALKNPTATRARARALLGLAELIMRLDGPVASAPLYGASRELYRTLNDPWGITLSLAYSLYVDPDETGAKTNYDTAMALAEQLGDEWLIANTYHRMGIHCYRQGDTVSARSLIQQGLYHARLSGDKWLIASSLANVGEVLRGNIEYELAAPFYEEALTRFQELGDQPSVTVMLHNIGYVALHRGDNAQAESLFRDSLKRHREHMTRRGVAECLIGMGVVATALKQYDRAVRLWGAANGLLEAIHDILDEADRAEYAPKLAEAHAALDERAFQTAWEYGRALTMDQVVHLALSND